MTNDSKKQPLPQKVKNNVSTHSDDFNLKVKKFLERDEFGLFKLKASKLLDKKINRTNIKIQKLLDLKSRAEQIYRNITIRKKNLIDENKKIKESLMVKLQSEVTEWMSQ